MIDYDIADRYQKKFGDSPPLIGIPGSVEGKLNDVMQKAIDTDKPLKTMAEWCAALGIAEPPDNAVL